MVCASLHTKVIRFNTCFYKLHNKSRQGFCWSVCQFFKMCSQWNGRNHRTSQEGGDSGPCRLPHRGLPHLYGGSHEKDEQNIFNETNKNAKEDLMFKEIINQNWQLKCNISPWDWGNQFLQRAYLASVKKKKIPHTHTIEAIISGEAK